MLAFLHKIYVVIIIYRGEPILTNFLRLLLDFAASAGLLYFEVYFRCLHLYPRGDLWVSSERASGVVPADWLLVETEASMMMRPTNCSRQAAETANVHTVTSHGALVAWLAAGDWRSGWERRRVKAELQSSQFVSSARYIRSSCYVSLSTAAADNTPSATNDHQVSSYTNHQPFSPLSLYFSLYRQHELWVQISLSVITKIYSDGSQPMLRLSKQWKHVTIT